MRDVFAGIAAVVLLLVAASLATTLKMYRRRRESAREHESSRGRTIIAEVPGESDLLLFSEDESRFYFGDRWVDKASIRAARVLINGSPIAAAISRRTGASAHLQATTFEDRPEGIARDRWDVAIETDAETLLIECGAIRERVSQELTRRIFDAVKRSIDERDGGRF